MYRYRVRYHRTEASPRIYYVTVTARDADDARVAAKIRDPLFSHTVSSPKRGGVVQLPEQADGLTASKAREFVEWRGTMVEVVD